MGLRLGGRGDKKVARIGEQREVLQWGRGSVAAETRCAPPRWGLPACFNGAAARWPRRQTVRDYVRAELTLLQWGRGSVAAETGLAVGALPVSNVLQWGRGSVAAETPEGRMGDDGKVKVLQWGRGSVAAETTEAYVAPYTEGV